MWQIHLIELYCAVCKYYDTTIHVEVQRLSNNSRPKFTDQELMTVYLWGTMKGLRSVKAIYTYTIMHLLEWYPALPSYQAFDRRLGEMGMAFAKLAECFINNRLGDGYDLCSLVIDSMPISLAKLSRADHAKVAQELCGKAYNSSRKEWYYGVKLHAVVHDRFKRLPALMLAFLSPANVHDLPCAKQAMDNFKDKNRVLYADKAYVDAQWAQTLALQNKVTLLTPHKRTRGEINPFPGGNARDTFISSVRQKIEIFFNWLHEKTGIQSASKVRSLKGLLFHTFGKLAAALASLALGF